MLKNCRKFFSPKYLPVIHHNRTFLTNEYKCSNAWIEQTSSSLLSRVKLNDFFASLNQSYASEGVISAIDVDIFANSIKDTAYLDELKDLLHKLRKSAETCYTLDSTHCATVRNYIEFGNIQDLVNILKDPLSYGIFVDNYTANILLDKLITSNNYELAANVAALVMLQEDFSNEITCALCQYACYKYVMEYSSMPHNEIPLEDNKKKEEVKIRIKFLRNPYFDDHFDIKETSVLSGKTLAWISKRKSDNVSNNLQILGWLNYNKFDRLVALCEDLSKNTKFKIYKEVIFLMEKHASNYEDQRSVLEKCILILNRCQAIETSLEDSINHIVENAINKQQKQDILIQEQLFKTWSLTREEKLEEQTQRLDRIKRIKTVEGKQKELLEQEQKLWFFDNEDGIDLQIENKERLVNTAGQKKSNSNKSDENYIPPEILPKRK